MSLQQEENIYLVTKSQIILSSELTVYGGGRPHTVYNTTLATGVRTERTKRERHGLIDRMEPQFKE